MDIKSLSQQLNMSVHELRAKMREAGFSFSPRVRKINNVLAREIIGKLSAKPEAATARPEAVTQTISIPAVITVKEFAQKLGQPVTAVIKKLIDNGVMATINEEIDADTAVIIGSEFGAEVTTEKKGEERGRLSLSYIDETLKSEKPEELKPRPPIVAIMGHVDHGKTTLLDTIRKTNVVAEEAGAITQHIGAYQVEVPAKQEPTSRATLSELKGRHGIREEGIPASAGDDFAGKARKITFLDTPGHEAFAAMRARGANVTDIIVLVVAADDSVKPQTAEVINRAKLTKTPLVVAINKIDKPDANPEKVKADLAELGVVVEQYGGKVPAAAISAKTGQGLDELLEVILLTAELEELKANPAGKTVAVVIESRLSRTQGPVATVLVLNGTLKAGDPVAVGAAYGKLRQLEDAKGQKVKEATPAQPVRITGLSAVPEVGDILRVTESLDEAKAVATQILRQERAKRLMPVKKIKADTTRGELNLILRADVQGSLEAIVEALTKLENESVKLNLVSQGAGEVTESDVQLAESTGSTIIGFNARVSPAADRLARQRGVTIDQYDVIYELVEDVTNALLELMPVEVIEKVLGRAKIKAIFRTEKKTMIVGGEVAEGKISDKKKFRILREGERVGTGKIEELQQNKVEVDEVRVGKEFGVKAEVTAPIAVGDVLEVYDEEVKKKTLQS